MKCLLTFVQFSCNLFNFWCRGILVIAQESCICLHIAFDVDDFNEIFSGISWLVGCSLIFLLICSSHVHSRRWNSPDFFMSSLTQSHCVLLKLFFSNSCCLHHFVTWSSRLLLYIEHTQAITVYPSHLPNSLYNSGSFLTCVQVYFSSFLL